MENNKNQIEDIMSAAIDKIKSMVDVTSVVGTPFESKDGSLIIPLTKVSIGFVAGGGEYGIDKINLKQLSKYPLSGGSGAGVCVYPVGLLVFTKEGCRLVRVDQKSAYDKLIETIPGIVQSVTSIFKKENNDESN